MGYEGFNCSPELPIVNFEKNKGMPSEEMTVKLCSLWVTQVDEVKNKGAQAGTSVFSIFRRKKVEPVPIYTNIVPCLVINFQTAALMEDKFIRSKLLFPVGVDAAQIEQPGKEEEKGISVKPSTHRGLTEQEALELLKA